MKWKFFSLKNFLRPPVGIEYRVEIFMHAETEKFATL